MLPYFPINHYSKIQISMLILSIKKRIKPTCFIWTFRLSNKKYGVATLSKSYLIITGISMSSLKR